MMPRGDTQIALRLLKRLYEHTETTPIVAEALGAEFGLKRREVMAYAAEFLDSGHKVASSKIPPYGMFIARTPAEAFDTAERLRKEGLKYLVRAKKLMTFDDAQRSIYEDITLNEIAEAEAEIGQ